MWILIALIAPAFYAMTNVLDKYMVHRYQKHLSPGALVFFMGIFSLVVLPFLGVIFPDSFFLASANILWLIIAGLITTLAWVPYMYALEKDDMSSVMPLYQLHPVLTFVMAYLFLGEILSNTQIIGGSIIILGAIILTKDPTKKWGVRLDTLGLILLSSLCLVSVEIIFKDTVQSIPYQNTLFWFFLGHALSGLLLLFVPSYRKEIKSFGKNVNRKFLGLMSINESLGLVADTFNMYAILLAPIALVKAISGFQGVFVFLYGIIITLFFPAILKEDLSRKTLIRKISALIIMLIGSFIIATQ
ncbi:MAG TPA: EamA family transporter [Candidatus Gracilibacteria bacterium]